MENAHQTAPSTNDIEALARATIESLPDVFRSLAKSVVLRVEDFAEDDILQDLDIPDPFQLTGLYDGVPMTQKSISDQPDSPDVIWLFRRAILDEWAARGDVSLSDLVAHVFIHELAHHFGWSDEDISSIDQWWT